MNNVIEFMTCAHRHCDESFIAAESFVSQQQWQQAQNSWDAFSSDLEHHLQQEENVLFPAFEAATGMTMGPTQVMRGEHVQMRQLVQQMSQALESKNQQAYLGLSETLMILMQQHNMKEEQMLYPMTQNNLPDPAQTIKAMEELPKE